MTALMKVQFLEKDQNWQEESTTYWFKLTGTDYGTEMDFSGDVYGVVESGGETTIVNSDNYPLIEGDIETIAIQNVVVITEKMRMA
ncbi:MAG: hypothetical protein GY800_13780 [Planctomycetes bacterium]|nr:hypothetical protein [Planctomycetota bacterium]